MGTGVVYLLTGIAHAARLVVSLQSLRKHYGGPVTLFSTQPESDELAGWLAADPRLGLDHRRVTPVPSRRNSTYLTKISVLREAPYAVTVFLDADTVIAGPLDELFALASDYELCATQFADWTTERRTIRKRLDAWLQLKVSTADATRIRGLVEVARLARPAINTGVFSIQRHAPFIEQWLALATLGWRTFICDEIALQLLIPGVSHRVLDCRYNCSPVYARSTDDVRIWHFHGDKHLRNDVGRNVWAAEFWECMQRDLGRITNWVPATDARLAEFLEAEQH